MTTSHSGGPYRQVVAGEVRAAMGRANVTQQQLAAQIGISPAGLSERLSGQRAFTTDHLYAIAEALGINPLTLFTPPAEVAAS